jgi:hypothetical protein
MVFFSNPIILTTFPFKPPLLSEKQALDLNIAAASLFFLKS